MMDMAPNPVNPNTKDSNPKMPKAITFHLITALSKCIHKFKNIKHGLKLRLFLAAILLNELLFHPCKINSLFQKE